MDNWKLLPFFLLITILLLPILQCKGQQSNLKIVQDQYNWNDDMKLSKITTPDRGLIFKITIWNNGSEPIDFANSYYYNTLWINVQVSSADTGRFFNFLGQLEINNLFLPPNESDVRFVKVDFGYGQVIGSYTAKLTYSFGSSPSEGQPITGEYPFDFRVLDNDTFNQEIQQIQKNRSGGPFLVIGPFNFTLIEVTGGGISITGISLALGLGYYWRKRKRK
jgi:hypothetical protein